MTIATSTSIAIGNGNGATTAWNYNFLIPASNEVLVQTIDTTVTPNVITTIMSNAYSITGLNNPTGGTVNYPLAGPALAAGVNITVQRQLPFVQATSIVNQSGFYPQVLEAALDYLTMLVQAVNDEMSLTVQVPAGSGITPANYLTTIQTASNSAAASASAASGSATAASGSASSASASASAASTSATAAAASAASMTASVLLASQWASLTSGIVNSQDYSAKAWAIGGTNLSDGAAKNWAQQTGADVTGATSGSRSSKSWAQEDLHGATYGGSAKDWAQSASLPDGTSKSAKSYAADASTSATAASGSATTATTQASAASTSATAASGSATTATTQASAASTSAASASSSATTATTQATNASTSATAAAASATTASAAAAAASAAAASLANAWDFASSTTMADPGTGNFRLDNATFGSVTNIAMSASSADPGNPNLHSYMLTWDDSAHTPRGIIRIAKNATNFILLGVNGNLTDNTTWIQFPVTVIASAGSFSAADATDISFTPYGNDGTGSGTVTTTGSPASGNLAKFSGSTSIVNGDLSGDITTSGALVTTIGANKVTSANLRQGVARSIIGVTGNATANEADIQASANQVLICPAAGTSLIFSTVTEAMQSITDVTTGNVSTAAHGYAPKGTNTGYKYLDDTGAYSTPTVRTTTTASSTTPTPNADTTNHYTITALAAAATFGSPTGTPLDGQRLDIRIKDNGTARALTWNAIYRAGTDVALPSTTVLSKTMYVAFVYNSADTKWDLVASMGNI